ncbi:MAG TPA: hypothetical protein VFB78_01220 [Acidimicrobiales bacterium]|nr:hypothetical protein [Acidimicrobiales bacterium]
MRATCPTCGDVELTVDQLTAIVCATNNEGSYAFQCPECGMAVVKEAEAHVVELLASAGVRLSVFELPAELEEPHLGQPLTHDDLLAFHDRLQGDDWFAEVEALVADTRNRSTPR